MVAHFRIIAIDFCTLYKGNNFRNNMDKSVNLESLSVIVDSLEFVHVFTGLR